MDERRRSAEKTGSSLQAAAGKMVRSAGLEPTTPGSASLCSIQLSYERSFRMVPKVGFEPTRPYGHYALNVARLPVPPLRHVFLVGDAGLEPATSSV